MQKNLVTEIDEYTTWSAKLKQASALINQALTLKPESKEHEEVLV